MRGIAQCIVTALAACLALAVSAGELRHRADRIVAFGDVHGAYDNLALLLEEASIVDADLRWRAGTTHLVSLGDLLDRGPDSRQVMDLLRRLQREAAEAGGRVHVVLGNHELMNLTGDLRYVSDGEYAAFAEPDATPAADGLPAGRQALQDAMRPEGSYGRWLLEQPSVVIINDTAFVHGGLPPVAARLSPEALEAEFKSRLRELLALRDELESAALIAPGQDVLESAQQLEARLTAPELPPAPDSATAEQDGRASDPAPGAGAGTRSDSRPAADLEPHLRAIRRFIELAGDELFSYGGVLWYRGTARCSDLLEAPVLSAALTHWQVERVVVGHSPTPDHRIRQRFDGTAILADTGMLTPYYGGQPSALLLQAAQEPEVFYPLEPAEGSQPEAHDFLEIEGLPRDAVAEQLRDAPLAPVGEPDLLHFRVGNGPLRARFHPGSKREVRAQLAAYALDRMLGLALVAPTVARRVDGRRGVLTAWWRQPVTETQRVEAQHRRSNWCARSNVFELMYAFDALIGNHGRSPENMVYDRASWRLMSVDHGRAFGRSEDFPAYLEAAPKVLPVAVADALRGLTPETVEEALGSYLSSREQRSLLARRDRLLATWAVEPAPGAGG